ncbi:hypothetical protein [Butyrivibrio sp.]|uniref:hypothetical protein n=1 Tax=Butyrivibrio sp. TaxID=28121 RepID=UPI0025B9BCF1|nr:hypothetical protein [Butyrivibrio sp.]MBQ9303371.1 hypothetical protein [Butyrivibrio sp.]
MNISFNTNNQYYSPYMKSAQGSLYAQNQVGKQGGASKNTIMGKSPVNPIASSFDKITDRAAEDRNGLSQQMRQMIRTLKQDSLQNQNNKKVNDFLETSGAPDAAETEMESAEKYNYKEVASKIRSAKTSNSAGQAVLAAKRAVTQIKRKISSGDGDPEELQLALTHAKRMEMVAKKKKHHLELEEMVTRTQKRDERLDQQKDAVQGMQSAITQAEEEKITEKEDEIFDEREEMLEEALAQVEESGEAVSDEMMAELNKMISEFGEEELKELQEAMEMLETMEIVDPHMSREDLEDLKRKHRASEEKAITKANMEYLKDMVKHELGKSEHIPAMGGQNASPIVSGNVALYSSEAMGSNSLSFSSFSCNA